MRRIFHLFPQFLTEKVLKLNKCYVLMFWITMIIFCEKLRSTCRTCGWAYRTTVLKGFDNSTCKIRIINPITKSPHCFTNPCLVLRGRIQSLAFLGLISLTIFITNCFYFRQSTARILTLFELEDQISRISEFEIHGQPTRSVNDCFCWISSHFAKIVNGSENVTCLASDGSTKMMVIWETHVLCLY